MKKIIILFIAIFMSASGFVLAQNEITFIYLNGSNTNDEGTKEWFVKGTEKFHPYLKKELEKDPLAAQKMLSGLKINPKPTQVYWGDQSRAEIEMLKENINFLNFASPKTAQFARRLISACLHDAIWVSKLHNMYPILRDVQKSVVEESEKGNKVVLLGYSAGSFITYQYLLNMLPAISVAGLNEIEDLQNKPEYSEAIRNSRLQNTCVDAIFKAKLVNYNISSAVEANPDIELFKKNLSLLDEYTKEYCAPPDTIVGIINYASPLTLFYSEFSDPRYKYGELNKLLFKYLVENNMFMLTVNYSDDPLGFPTTRNITVKEVEEKAGMEIYPQTGLLYDKSNLSSHRTFMLAHTSYWSTGKRFAKIITKAYNEGYANFFTK